MPRAFPFQGARGPSGQDQVVAQVGDPGQLLGLHLLGDLLHGRCDLVALVADHRDALIDVVEPLSARTRLRDLVSRSGILVFASHSNEFLAQLCDRALWIDHGQVRMEGGIEEVVEAYEGPDAAAHVRRVIADLEKADKKGTPE